MPAPRVQHSLTLFGSAPWGFRVSGGTEYNQPLVVSRVTPGSLAARSGVTSGDVLIAVNNQYVSNMSQDECEAKVRQAVGSLHLVLEKNAAKVTELPGGQVQVEGDRSVYTKLQDTQQRIAKFNRSAKPFGAPSSPAGESKETQEKSDQPQSGGFRPVAFKAPAKSQAAPSLPISARGEPDGINSAAESMAKVTLDKPAEESSDIANTPKTYNITKYNRKPAPFFSANTSNNSSVISAQNDDDSLPPPPDFVLNPSQEETKPDRFSSSTYVEPIRSPGAKKEVVTRKVLGPNAALGLYSKANADETYKAQTGDL